MLTFPSLWILLASNKFIFNLFILILFTTVFQNYMNLEILNNTKLLFNSYISYDLITISIILIGSLVAIWLVSITVNSSHLPNKWQMNLVFYYLMSKTVFKNNEINNLHVHRSSTALLDNVSEVQEPHQIRSFEKDRIWKGEISDADKTSIFNSSKNVYDLSSELIKKNALIVNIEQVYKKLKLESKDGKNNEFLTLIFLLMIAMASLASTNNYLTLFVAIELQSLTLYILLATNISKFKVFYNLDLSKLNKLSKVSLSYLINAATATALLLLGFTIENNLLILIAILWKLGIMPLHVWSLPILDNQHSLIVSIYLTITKYGTLLVIGLVAGQSLITISILTYIGLLNLTVGNILGLLQYRYQRIIVYSSLIQIGYMLLILANNTSLGIGYFELYSFFTIMLLMLWIVPTYNKLNANNLLPSVQLWTLVLILYTVAGLPFFPLFWTKLDVLLTIQSQSLLLALVGTLLGSLIYVRLIKYMSHLKSQFSINS